MREYFDLAEKYGFKAPLASAPESFDLKHFTRLCNSLEISATSISVATSVFLELTKIDEQISSLEHLASKINRTAHNIRHHLQLLEKQGLVESEFVTTDPIKKRRGKLFHLHIPTKIINIDQGRETAEDFKLVPTSQIEEISTDLSNLDVRLITVIVTRFLVKAMRTNRKDKSQENIVSVLNRDGKKIKVTSVAESNRLMYVGDLSYYTGALTWLYSHIEYLLETGQQVTETYTLPLEKLISICKNIPTSDASSGGYVDNAINALRRISASTFQLSDLPMELHQQDQIKGLDLFFKLYRLEAIVTYEENGSLRRAARIQFPKHTIDSIVKSVSERNSFDQFMLIDDELLATHNEIEILLGLWARDQYAHSLNHSQSFTWNELRETIAPGSKLTEFKRKFSAIIIANADPEYKASIDESVRKKISDQIGTTYLTGKGESLFVIYGRAICHGFLINIGYSASESTTKLFFRRDMSGLIYTPRGIKSLGIM